MDMGRQIETKLFNERRKAGQLALKARKHLEQERQSNSTQRFGRLG
jgi:hypothetical protein